MFECDGLTYFRFEQKREVGAFRGNNFHHEDFVVDLSIVSIFDSDGSPGLMHPSLDSHIQLRLADINEIRRQRAAQKRNPGLFRCESEILAIDSAVQVMRIQVEEFAK